MNPARRIAFRIALGIVLAGALALLAPAFGESYGPARAFAIARASGWLASIALLGALVITPVRRLRRALGRPELGWLAALRRSFGIAAASCGLLHAGYSLANVPGVVEALFELGWLRAGIGAIALLSLLLATSFDAVIRRLRLQHWAELHWLVYPAALLIAAHAVLGPAGSPVLELTFCLCVVLLLGLRLVITRKRAASSIAE